MTGKRYSWGSGDPSESPRSRATLLPCPRSLLPHQHNLRRCGLELLYSSFFLSQGLCPLYIPLFHLSLVDPGHSGGGGAIWIEANNLCCIPKHLLPNGRTHVLIRVIEFFTTVDFLVKLLPNLDSDYQLVIRWFGFWFQYLPFSDFSIHDLGPCGSLSVEISGKLSSSTFFGFRSRVCWCSLVKEMAIMNELTLSPFFYF
jgi:hypothetical protein